MHARCRVPLFPPRTKLSPTTRTPPLPPNISIAEADEALSERNQTSPTDLEVCYNQNWHILARPAASASSNESPPSGALGSNTQRWPVPQHLKANAAGFLFFISSVAEIPPEWWVRKTPPPAGPHLRTTVKVGALSTPALIDGGSCQLMLYMLAQTISHVRRHTRACRRHRPGVYPVNLNNECLQVQIKDRPLTKNAGPLRHNCKVQVHPR